jgi:serine/threonine protein kinase/Tol biopolymer transport system component
VSADARRLLVESICLRALELSGATRAAYVRDACGGDAELCSEIEGLLAHASAEQRFLDDPVGAVAAAVVTGLGTRPQVERGTKFAHFEVLAPLGAGGQGRVFRARDTELRRDVALKVLAGEPGDGAAVRQSLVREARRAASLSHPGICQVFHIGDSSHGPFMVMELVDGQTLRDTLLVGPLPVAQVCRIGAGIAHALDHAHAHGVVHRDLKSGNVMVTADGHVKVLDFGIATLVPGRGHGSALTSNDGITVQGVAGTLPYMAPEVLRSEGAGTATDIWALGVVLYEMTTGRLPFDRDRPADLLASILRDPPARLPGECPPPLADVIARCLSKDPTGRPSASEAARALEPFSEAPKPSAQPRSRPRAWAARLPAMSIGAAAIAAMGWQLSWDPTVSQRDPWSPVRLGRATQLTSAAGVEEFPAVSPDGRTVAYAAGSGPSEAADWDIWVTQPGGTPVNRTTGTTGRDLFPSWSPDGAQIAFWSDRDGGGCYVMPAMGGAARRVAAASRTDPNAPLWSSDGRELSCVIGTPADAVLATFDVGTGQQRRQVALPGDGRRMFVTPSPDGRQVAMIVSPGGLSADLAQLFLLDVATGRSAPVTSDQARAWSPAWRADGGSLLYVSNAGGNTDVWEQRLNVRGEVVGQPVAITTGIGIRNFALTPDGGALAYSQGRKVANVWRVPILRDRPAAWVDATQVTFDQAYVEFVDVSADGRRLAISSDRAASFDLWVLPAAGGELRQLTSDAGAEYAPRWSPDDQTFAFYSLKSGNRDVWAMPSLGGEWRRLTTDPGPDLIPSWSPDGREVVHLSGRGTYGAVWVTPAAGGEGREIVRAVSGGRFSPDGRQVVFSSGTAPAGRIERRSSSGEGDIVPLSTIPGFSPVWTRDGSQVVFVGAAAYSGNLFAVGSDGAGERAVTDLRGRRGTIVANSLAIDDRFLYFSWQEDLGDLWVADLVK